MSCGTAAQVVPALHQMEEEPAWPYFVAGHQPQDWPSSEPPPERHQDLVYLATERAVGDETAQAIHSFYSFMLVCLSHIVPSNDTCALSVQLPWVLRLRVVQRGLVLPTSMLQRSDRTRFV